MRLLKSIKHTFLSIAAACASTAQRNAAETRLLEAKISQHRAETWRKVFYDARDLFYDTRDLFRGEPFPSRPIHSSKHHVNDLFRGEKQPFSNPAPKKPDEPYPPPSAAAPTTAIPAGLSNEALEDDLEGAFAVLGNIEWPGLIKMALAYVREVTQAPAAA